MECKLIALGVLLISCASMCQACSSLLNEYEGERITLPCECSTNQNNPISSRDTHESNPPLPRGHQRKTQHLASFSATCSPDKTWYKDGAYVGECSYWGSTVYPPFDRYLQITNDGDLLIDDTEISQAGKYHCTYEWSRTHTITFNVLVPPEEIHVTLQPSSIRENSTTMWGCEIPRVSPPSETSIYWVKSEDPNTKIYGNSNPVSNGDGSFKIMNTVYVIFDKEDDEGDFSCVGTWSGEDPVVEDKVEELDVEYSPRDIWFETDPPGTDQIEDTVVVFSCSIDEANPLPYLAIYRGSFTKLAEAYNSKSLRHSHVMNREDQGVSFYCRASSPVIVGGGMQSKTTVFDILYLPHVFLSSTPPSIITEGNTLYLNCDITGGNPSLGFTRIWTLQPKYDSNVTSSVPCINPDCTINNVGYMDAGTYICEVETSAGRASDVRLINVQYSPKPTSQDRHEEVYAKEGDPLTLTLEVQALPNLVTARWFYQESDNISQPFDSNLTSVEATGDEISLATLNIHLFHSKYFGNITCFTQNEVGTGDVFVFFTSPEPEYVVGGGLKGGGIAGIVIASMVVLSGLVLLVVWIFTRRRTEKKNEKASHSYDNQVSQDTTQGQLSVTSQPDYLELIEGIPPYHVTTLSRGEGSGDNSHRRSQPYDSSGYGGYEYIDGSGMRCNNAPRSPCTNDLSTSPRRPFPSGSQVIMTHNYDTPVAAHRSNRPPSPARHHYNNTAKEYLRLDPSQIVSQSVYSNTYTPLDNPYEEINPDDVRTLQRGQQVPNSTVGLPHTNSEC